MKPDNTQKGAGGTAGEVRKIRVLVVDDEPVQVESIARGLFLYGYECTGAPDVLTALDLIYGRTGLSPDIIITDLTMPRGSGFELIKIVRAFRPSFPIIVITGLTAAREVEELEHDGIPVILKPFDPEKLDRDIRALLANTAGCGGDG